jgi:hypothetical protein
MDEGVGQFFLGGGHWIVEHRWRRGLQSTQYESCEASTLQVMSLPQSTIVKVVLISTSAPNIAGSTANKVTGCGHLAELTLSLSKLTAGEAALLP